MKLKTKEKVPVKARMHSAEHIMFAVMKRKYPKLISTSLHLGKEKSRYCYKLPGEKISEDGLKQIEKGTNEKIKEGIKVEIETVSRSEAEKVCTPNLFRLVPKSQKRIRLVKIGNFNTEACAGKHVSNTKQIGNFKFLKHKKIGKDTYRADFTVLDEIKKMRSKPKKEKFELETAKGVRDFPPEEKIIRDKVVDTLKEVFESYGYNPFEQPILERLDVLTAKFGAGEESDAYKEIFKFKDQGGREIGLRFELTLSLCRFIAMNPNLKLPFKRYEIGRVYRDGPIKLGRYREFWQCDVDIVGTSSMLADAEIIAITRDVFKKLGFEVVIEVSNRKLLNGILEEAGVAPKLRMPAMISIDKLKRIGIEGVKKELAEKGLSQAAIKKMAKILILISLDIKRSNSAKIKNLKKIVNNKIGKEGLAELEELFRYLDLMKVDNAVFNPALARGLLYYTGPVYEAFLKKSKVTYSVAGGGRYDEFIGNFLGRKTQIPATGISFGLEPITEAIKLRTKESRKSVSKVYVIPIKTTKESLKITQELRKAGIKTDIDLIGRGISKNLSYANSLKIPFVIIIGKEEIKNKKIKLRNMKTGRERLLKVKELIKIFKK